MSKSVTVVVAAGLGLINAGLQTKESSATLTVGY